MFRTPFALLLLVALVVTATGAGCRSGPRGPLPRTASDAAMFAPLSMRVHPVFTDVKDWTGDGAADGIEALLEFEDQFGDPTKASGTVVFELFTYRPHHPDTRGERVVNPWLGSLQTLGDQQARWNRTSRTYQFRLSYPQVSERQSYVLAATFDTGATRFFDQVILEGRERPRDEEVIPATRSVVPIAGAGAGRPLSAGQTSAGPLLSK